MTALLAASTALAILVSPVGAQEATIQPAQMEEQGSEVPGILWRDTPRHERHLLIMGIIDGLSAAGAPQQPCFPAMNNEDIARNIENAKPDLDSNPRKVADAILEIASQCPTSVDRPYGTDLFRSIPQEHSMVYASGLLAGWNAAKICHDEVTITPESLRRQLIDPASSSSIVTAARTILQAECPKEQ